MLKKGIILGGVSLSIAAGASANMIDNGSFELGDMSFGSDYLSTVHDGGNIFNQAVYHVGNNPSSVHGAFANMGDHTTGSGNMMIVNGSSVTTDRVWYQTLAVAANTDYYFSTWIASVHPTSPAILVFSIDGVQLGPTINAPNTTGNWIQYYATWNSGSSTSVDLAIVNQNPTFSGNDFALDDIAFGTDLVPEPATIGAMGVGIAAMLRRKRK